MDWRDQLRIEIYQDTDVSQRGFLLFCLENGFKCNLVNSRERFFPRFTWNAW